jgi:hypothetical protein
MNNSFDIKRARKDTRDWGSYQINPGSIPVG